MKKKISNWKFFKWGAKNHPGNLLYAMIVLICFVSAFQNENVKIGLIVAGVVTFVLLILYISTSISVGKANENLVREYYEND